MNDDRELLELAAKAAGAIDDRVSDDNAFGLHLAEEDGMPYVSNNYGWQDWNPLTDDGDALRLAVKLGLQIVPRHRISDPTPIAASAGFGADDFDKTETMYGNDPRAATRRAIVRAAAAIGATKP